MDCQVRCKGKQFAGSTTNPVYIHGMLRWTVRMKYNKGPLLTEQVLSIRTKVQMVTTFAYLD